ncbi:hypothetical protein SynPROS71_00100 [Synechococcus sp. PROS-7-1]|nr:hypothetical protein SynPROS71_00100 [Synechococcus sp. PROS-7-1]
MIIFNSQLPDFVNIIRIELIFENVSDSHEFESIIGGICHHSASATF